MLGSHDTEMNCYYSANICKGINDGQNMILHGMEVKLHLNGVKVKDGSGKTNINGLYIIGDCSSHPRGNIQSASMGILCAKDIVNKSH